MTSGPGGRWPTLPTPPEDEPRDLLQTMLWTGYYVLRAGVMPMFVLAMFSLDGDLTAGDAVLMAYLALFFGAFNHLTPEWVTNG